MLSRPKRAMSASGGSSWAMRPSRRMMTRSHSRSISAMLCEASRMVALRRSRKRSRWPRTQSARSGSSEAVGSSSRRSSGSLISALARATRVFCPAESWPLRRSRNGTRSSAWRVRRCAASGRDAVELAEHREVLAHGEAQRQVGIGAFEIDAVQHLVALARHVGAEHRDRARCRRRQPHDHGERRRLARAVAAEQADDAAGLDAKRQPVDGDRGVESFGQLVGEDGGRAHGVGKRDFVDRSASICQSTRIWPWRAAPR